MSEQKLTGYPSVDKPWLKYYSKAVITGELPRCGAYELLFEKNKDHLGDTALNYYGRKISYSRFR